VADLPLFTPYKFGSNASDPYSTGFNCIPDYVDLISSKFLPVLLGEFMGGIFKHTNTTACQIISKSPNVTANLLISFNATLAIRLTHYH
jgi:hypothetical protein